MKVISVNYQIMKTFQALELEPGDFHTPEKRDQAVRAMAHAQIVIYRGEVVKNTAGHITRRLSDMQAAERRKGARVY